MFPKYWELLHEAKKSYRRQMMKNKAYCFWKKWSYIGMYYMLEHLTLDWVSCPESYLLLQGNRLNLDPRLIIWWDSSLQTWVYQNQPERLLKYRWLDPGLRVWDESPRICILMVFQWCWFCWFIGQTLRNLNVVEKTWNTEISVHVFATF